MIYDANQLTGFTADTALSITKSAGDLVGLYMQWTTAKSNATTAAQRAQADAEIARLQALAQVQGMDLEKEKMKRQVTMVAIGGGALVASVAVLALVMR